MLFCEWDHAIAKSNTENLIICENNIAVRHFLCDLYITITVCTVILFPSFYVLLRGTTSVYICNSLADGEVPGLEESREQTEEKSAPSQPGPSSIPTRPSSGTPDINKPVITASGADREKFGSLIMTYGNFHNTRRTYWHGNTFRIAGPLWPVYKGPNWLPSERARKADFFVIFFVVSMNKLQNKQSISRWFEMPHRLYELLCLVRILTR